MAVRSMEMTVLAQAETTPEVVIDGDRLWVGTDEVTAATGWELKPEGLCRGEQCIPVSEPISDHDGRVDLRGVARALRCSLVVDEGEAVIALAGDPMATGAANGLADFALPLLTGGQLDFGNLVGRKTLVIAWASW